ncbi:MAG TPA: GPR1/FUN34/YaaH family transporter, partial [Candidatus Ozemobacteraceae bacterium]|nr:GPR1/FUN34/YaaH family transporter [Candidatus Ozemobacteraceae bacterium]
MIKRIDIAPPHNEVFGNPAPLGLIGLAVACAAITPVAFKFTLTAEALKTAAIYCVLFGGACQFITGIMEFANKNVYGGTIFTAFAFNWIITGWTFYALAQGFMPDHHVLLAVEITLFVIFVILTYGFGFFSKLLFFFLVDIDLLYVCKIAKALTHHPMLDFPIALLTVILGFMGFWLAMAALINPLARQEIFKTTGPMFVPQRRKPFDWSLRRAIFDILYHQWRQRAFEEMTIDEFRKQLKAKVGERNPLPDIWYLKEYGCLELTVDPSDKNKILSMRL